MSKCLDILEELVKVEDGTDTGTVLIIIFRHFCYREQ